MYKDFIKNHRSAMPSFNVAEYDELRRFGKNSIKKSPFPLLFTKEALTELLRSVGSVPPETGAKCFGPKDKFGIDLIEYDIFGSKHASGAVYAPDNKWGNERMDYHIQVPEEIMRQWNGDVHSHPGVDYGFPSGKDGKGLGDLGYVEEIFSLNESIEYFAIPIITNTCNGKPKIWPWICKRGTPLELLFADVIICDSSDFPEKEYNPDWLKIFSKNNNNSKKLTNVHKNSSVKSKPNKRKRKSKKRKKSSKKRR